MGGAPPCLVLRGGGGRDRGPSPALAAALRLQVRPAAEPLFSPRVSNPRGTRRRAKPLRCKAARFLSRLSRRLGGADPVTFARDPPAPRAGITGYSLVRLASTWGRGFEPRFPLPNRARGKLSPSIGSVGRRPHSVAHSGERLPVFPGCQTALSRQGSPVLRRRGLEPRLSYQASVSEPELNRHYTAPIGRNGWPSFRPVSRFLVASCKPRG